MFTTGQGELGDALGLRPKVPIRNCINYSRAIVLSFKKLFTPLMVRFCENRENILPGTMAAYKKGDVLGGENNGVFPARLSVSTAQALGSHS